LCVGFAFWNDGVRINAQLKGTFLWNGSNRAPQPNVKFSRTSARPARLVVIERSGAGLGVVESVWRVGSDEVEVTRRTDPPHCLLKVEA